MWQEIRHKGKQQTKHQAPAPCLHEKNADRKKVAFKGRGKVMVEEIQPVDWQIQADLNPDSGPV